MLTTEGVFLSERPDLNKSFLGFEHKLLWLWLESSLTHCICGGQGVSDFKLHRVWSPPWSAMNRNPLSCITQLPAIICPSPKPLSNWDLQTDLSGHSNYLLPFHIPSLFIYDAFMMHLWFLCAVPSKFPSSFIYLIICTQRIHAAHFRKYKPSRLVLLRDDTKHHS